MQSRKYRWWHGLAFYAGVQVARFGLKVLARGMTGNRKPASREEDREFYRSEKTPSFAPPPAAFPIAWGINSISAIKGAIHVLNLPPETEGRTEYLQLQAAAWALFAAFDAAYFEMRSPINAAAITLAYSVLTVASIDVAYRKMDDPAAARSLATTALWLAIANPVGILQAAWNHDEFWHAGPFLEA